jgi:hypothetical protein
LRVTLEIAARRVIRFPSSHPDQDELRRQGGVHVDA